MEFITQYGSIELINIEDFIPMTSQFKINKPVDQILLPNPENCINTMVKLHKVKEISSLCNDWLKEGERRLWVEDELADQMTYIKPNMFITTLNEAVIQKASEILVEKGIKPKYCFIFDNKLVIMNPENVIIGYYYEINEKIDKCEIYSGLKIINKDHLSIIQFNNVNLYNILPFNKPKRDSKRI